MTSVAVELGQAYMNMRVRQAVETKIPQDPTQMPDNGVKINGVRLFEQWVGVNRLNLVSIDIEPWLKGASGSPASLQRYYTLTLRIVPHLINPQTVPEPARRKQLLRCGTDPECGESAVLLAFDFYELYSKSFTRKVECQSKDFDPIDAQVLTGIYASLYGNGTVSPPALPQDPIVVPTQEIVKLVSGLVGAPAQLTGVAIGSDLDLKIGLLMDKGSPAPFDRQAGIRGDDDWGVSIDTAFVTSAIRNKAVAKAQEVNSAIAINSFSVTYIGGLLGPNKLDILAFGSWPRGGACGVTNFKLTAEADLLVCRKANGKSVLKVCEGPSDQSPTSFWDFLSGVCGGINDFIGNFFGGLSTATITTGCPDMAELQFPAGTNDVLYATRLDAEGVFYIAGQSPLRDALLGRTPGSTACQ
jgi:hypothetical protein